MLELKDRLPRAPIGAPPGGAAVEPPAIKHDVVSALINLGYHRPLAEKAAESAVKGTAGGDFEQTLKQALRELAR